MRSVSESRAGEADCGDFVRTRTRTITLMIARRSDGGQLRMSEGREKEVRPRSALTPCSALAAAGGDLEVLSARSFSPRNLSSQEAKVHTPLALPPACSLQPSRPLSPDTLPLDYALSPARPRRLRAPQMVKGASPRQTFEGVSSLRWTLWLTSCLFFLLSPPR